MFDREFERYARSEFGVSPMTMHRYSSVYDAYINPTIIEERRLNVASMDVFSRLMMDRIVFLGVPRMYPRSVQAWPLQWVLSCSVQGLPGRGLPSNIRA